MKSQKTDLRVETPIKERPILFSSPMVRAIREGRKTQTRRPVKPHPADDCFVLVDYGDGWVPYRSDDGESQSVKGDWVEEVIACPYGQPGDRLWVRENGWERPERTAKMLREGADTWEPYYYDADGISEQEAADFKAWGFKRRPSIHMPRWASRILLEVGNVRVERLHDLTERDAMAEGVEPVVVGEGWRRYCDTGMELAGVVPCETARGSFRSLWGHLNGEDHWGANPWVWVVEFSVIQPAAFHTKPQERHEALSTH